MKNTILSTVTIIALSACSLFAESSQTPDEATLLRQEIKKQELVLQALKEKLASLEEKNLLEVSITSKGLSAHGKQISTEDLKKALSALSEDAKILIRAEPTVSHKEVVSVMELCAKAGLKNVAFATTKAESGRPD